MEISNNPHRLNTVTADDRAGVHRSKPLSTTLGQAAVNGPDRSKPLNTSLGSIKPPTRTHITSADLNGDRAKTSTMSQHDRLVKQTRSWVAQTFFGTLMKQMRESPFKSELFDGGRGGQAFGSMYDQQLAERMARGAGSHLVNSIVHRIEARAAAVQQKVAEQRMAG